MTQLTNGQHACVLVLVPMDILNVPCDCQFVFSVLELCFTPRLMQRVIF